MANMSFGVNILPKPNTNVTLGNSDNPWTIVNPTISGILSKGRESNSTIGDNSFAFGTNVISRGNTSTVFGRGTIAAGDSQFVFGEYNWEQGEEPEFPNVQEWNPNWDYYEQGDIVKRTVEGAETRYICIDEGCPAGVFTNEYWREIHRSNFIEIVGNGLCEGNHPDRDLQSNARALDWDGNEYLNGTLYVNCGADSTNGTKVFTTAGGTVTGNIYIQHDGIDLTEANNGLSSAQSKLIFVEDSNEYNFIAFEGGAKPDGTVYAWVGVQNRDENGTATGWRGISIYSDKGGNASYNVSNPSAFRTAIGALGPDANTMNTNGYIARDGNTTGTYVLGRDLALIKITTYSAYTAILSQKTTNGSWQLGTYTGNDIWFTYTSDNHYNSTINGTSKNYYTKYGLKICQKLYNTEDYSYTKYLTDAFDTVTRTNKTFTFTPLDGGTATTVDQLNRAIALSGTVKLADTTETTLNFVPGTGVSITYASGGSFTFSANGNFNSYITVDRTATAMTTGSLYNVLIAKAKNNDQTATYNEALIDIIGTSETGDNNNFCIRMGSKSGTTIVTAGECGKTIASANSFYHNENLYLASDNNVYIYPGVSNAGALAGCYSFPAPGSGTTYNMANTVFTTGTQTIAGVKQFTGTLGTKNSATSPTIAFYGEDLASANLILAAQGAETSAQKFGQVHLRVRQYSPASDGTRTSYYEYYDLPKTATGLTANKGYTILTTNPDARTTTSTISSIATPASGNTITAAYFVSYGFVATLAIVVTVGTAVTGNTSSTPIATLVAGKRPGYHTVPAMRNNSTYGARITAAGVIQVFGAISANASITVYATYIFEP